MNLLGIIPARAGSKRVPRKNVRSFGGKPLCTWIIEAALRCACFDRLVVSSDDDEVLAIAEQCAAGLALRRPPEIAQDHSLAIDYVRHALRTTEAGGARYDGVVIMQVTSPLTRTEDIEGTVELLRRTGAESTTTVVELDFAIHPAKLKLMHGDRLFPYLEEERGRTAQHQLPTVYVRSGSVYASRRDVIERGIILGDDCRGHIMPRQRSVDINEEADFLYAEFLRRRLAD